MRSLPAPPLIEAAGPVITSLPLPPSRTSAWVPPMMLSLPSSPLSVAFDVPVLNRKSVPAPPYAVTSPPATSMKSSQETLVSDEQPEPALG